MLLEHGLAVILYLSYRQATDGQSKLIGTQAKNRQNHSVGLFGPSAKSGR